MSNGFSKQLAEKFTIGADFANALDSGESISESLSTVTAVDGSKNDATDDVLTDDSKSVSGTELKIGVEGGTVANSPYKITFLATTNLNNVYELDVLMTVLDI